MPPTAMADKPVCMVVAGPNGAGKTTFAMRYLPEVAGCRNFVNADMIASGLAPLSPQSGRMAAGRLLLAEIRRFAGRRESFAFETTLAGRGYANLVRRLRADGWRIVMYYLWLPDAQWSQQRVAERVESGGHHIPADAIRRRYPRSIRNLLQCYAPLCDSIVCLDNTVPGRYDTIFEQDGAGRKVHNERLYTRIMEAMR